MNLPMPDVSPSKIHLLFNIGSTDSALSSLTFLHSIPAAHLLFLCCAQKKRKVSKSKGRPGLSLNSKHNLQIPVAFCSHSKMPGIKHPCDSFQPRHPWRVIQLGGASRLKKPPLSLMIASDLLAIIVGAPGRGKLDVLANLAVNRTTLFHKKVQVV